MGKDKINNQSNRALPIFLQGRTSKLAERLSWLIAGILALLPFHALLSTWAGSNFGHLDVWRIWKEILFLLMLPAAAWLAWRTPPLKKWLAGSWIVRLFGLYVLLHLFLGGWAYIHDEVNKTALIYSLIINLRFIAFFILCAIVASHSDFLIRHWRKILLIPAGVVVVFGLLQKFLLPYDFLRHFGYGKGIIAAFHTIDNDPDLVRLQSTLRGPNPLGAYLVLTIPVLWFSKDGSWKQAKRWLLIAVSVTVLFFTYSRSAEIGLALTLGLLAWWEINRRTSNLQGLSLQRRQLAVFVSAILILVIGGLYVFRNSQTVQETFLHDSPVVSSAQTSNEVRFESISKAASDVIHQPLGRGPGTAGPASARNDHPARISENYFLQIGQEVGVIGITLFIAINILVAKELLRRRADMLARILLAALVGLTFVNLLSHAWADDTLSYLWWGLAGIAVAIPAVISKK